VFEASADTFAGAHIVPVIDDTVVERQRLENYLADLQTRPLRLEFKSRRMLPWS